MDHDESFESKEEDISDAREMARRLFSKQVPPPPQSIAFSLDPSSLPSDQCARHALFDTLRGVAHVGFDILFKDRLVSSLTKKELALFSHYMAAIGVKMHLNKLASEFSKETLPRILPWYMIIGDDINRLDVEPNHRIVFEIM